MERGKGEGMKEEGRSKEQGGRRREEYLCLINSIKGPQGAPEDNTIRNRQISPKVKSDTLCQIRIIGANEIFEF